MTHDLGAFQGYYADNLREKPVETDLSTLVFDDYTGFSDYLRFLKTLTPLKSQTQSKPASTSLQLSSTLLAVAEQYSSL
jgi:hypothetical protein